MPGGEFNSRGRLGFTSWRANPGRQLLSLRQVGRHTLDSHQRRCSSWTLPGRGGGGGGGVSFMCPPCLQSLGKCTHLNNSQRTQRWPCCGPRCSEDRGTQSWLGHLTGRGCARQRSRKQEARTVSQELNVFRKWPRREEGERLLPEQSTKAWPLARELPQTWTGRR